MQTKLTPYINFMSSTREAMTFYQAVFGGKLTLSTFKEFQAAQSLEEEELIMHSQLETANGMTIMASDTPMRMEFKPGTNFSLSLSGNDAAELSGYFEKLSEGGTITQPLVGSTWGDTFGMCIDRFGITWLVNISK